MDQTTFLMNDDQRPNSTPVHVKGEDGTWASIGEILNQAPDYWAGGHGLYGPPSDYIKFQRALLRGGELDGTRILRQWLIAASVVVGVLLGFLLLSRVGPWLASGPNADH